MNFVKRIIAYENGELSQEETIQLFQEMVDTGIVWKLQGHYGRTAEALIEAEQITCADAANKHVQARKELLCEKVKKNLTSS
jgi:precorrin isomerase